MTPSARKSGKGLSIFLKLLALIVSLVLGIAALLASYLSSRQMQDMQSELETKAATYGRLTSKQVESAIAFDDRETAREVFDSVAEDRDVESLSLFTSRGAVLQARGAMTPNLALDLSKISRPTPFTTNERIGIAVPIVSLEGPRGTLVVELSTRRLFEARSRVLRQAGVACLLAALAGSLGAFLIARSLARRIGAIATVADAVAAGDLSQNPVPDGGARDEIGVLAGAFNAMLSQLQTLIAQIRQSAHEEQARLETLVEARTVELAGRNDDMRRVLNNVGQGFVTLDLDGRMSRERSAILETWFGPAPESGLLVDYLARVDAAMAEWFGVCWQAVLDGMLPLSVAMAQLPKHVTFAGRHFEFDYRALLGADGQLERVVVVLSDETAAVERARAETDEREATQLFKRLIADRAGFLEFFGEACALVEQIKTERADHAALARALHTLKGNAGLYGIDSIAQLAHGLEDSLAETQQLSDADVAPLAARWSDMASKIRELVGDERNALEVDESDYTKALFAIERGVPLPKLRDMLLAWRLEPTQVRLRRIGEQAQALAQRLEKGPISVEIESNELRLPPERWNPFWAAAVHVVRNAIDHGLESPDQRADSGKTSAGRLVLRTCVRGDVFAIEFADDGRGIDWSAVERKAVAAGAPSKTHSDLVNALFLDGLSTKDAVTDISGRGVGLGAVRQACQDLGGAIEIESQLGLGTTIRFIWPAKLLAAAGLRIARSSLPPPLRPAGYDRVG
jgi:two-component system chemotaxis sensor kinase CheA